jgi:hypothetical protein
MVWRTAKSAGIIKAVLGGAVGRGVIENGVVEEAK